MASFKAHDGPVNSMTFFRVLGADPERPPLRLATTGALLAGKDGRFGSLGGLVAELRTFLDVMSDGCVVDVPRGPIPGMCTACISLLASGVRDAVTLAGIQGL